MTDDPVTEDYRALLREAIEEEAGREIDWNAFHARLNGGPVASRLAARRDDAPGGFRATTAAGAAWWNYTPRAALAAVPLGLAAALLLTSYLRGGNRGDADPVATEIAAAPAQGNADSARVAFESVLVGAAAPRAVMGVLLPVPAAAYLAESAVGRSR